MTRFLQILASTLALISAPIAAQTAINARQITLEGVRLDATLASNAANIAVAGSSASFSQARSMVIPANTSRIMLIDRDQSTWTSIACAGLSALQQNYSWFSDAGGRCWQLAAKPVTFSMFGASGASNADQTVTLQRAIDFAAGAGVPIREYRVAFYFATQLTFPSGLKLQGSQTSKTLIRHFAGTTIPLVVIPAGPVRLDISDVQFVGNGLPYEHGLYLQAKPDGSGTGGLWYSRFARMQVGGFGGKGVWERGGTGDSYNFLLPNQFNTYDDVIITRTALAGSRALSLTGQAGQHYFVGVSQFDGPNSFAGGAGSGRSGTNVVFGGEYVGGSDPIGAGDAGDALDNNGALKSGWVAAGAQGRPTVIDFRATSQNSDRAILLDGAGQVSISHSWFENVNRTVSAYNSSSFSVTFSHFANAAGDVDAAGTGWGVMNNFSNMQYGGNDFTGLRDFHYKATTPQSSSRLAGDAGPVGFGDSSSGTTFQATPAAAASGAVSGMALTIRGNETVLVNGGTTTPVDVSQIISSHNPGAFISLRAFGGLVRILPRTLTNDNIDVPGKAIVLRANDTVTLRKFDSSAKYQVVGSGIAALTSTSMPTSGYYEVGEFVRNTSLLATGAVTFGWYRLTTGTGHTSGTDWRTIQVTGV